MIGTPIFHKGYFNRIGSNSELDSNLYTKESWDCIFENYNISNLSKKKNKINNICDTISRHNFSIKVFKNFKQENWNEISNNPSIIDFLTKNMDLLPSIPENDKNFTRAKMIGYFNNEKTLKLFENLSFLEAFFKKYNIDTLPVFRFSHLSKSFHFLKNNKDYLCNKFGEFEWLENIIVNPHPENLQFMLSHQELIWKYNDHYSNVLKDIIYKIHLNPVLINLLLYNPHFYYKYLFEKKFLFILKNPNAINVYHLFKQELFLHISSNEPKDSILWKTFLLNKNNLEIFLNDETFIKEVKKKEVLYNYLINKALYYDFFKFHFPNSSDIPIDSLNYCIDYSFINKNYDMSLLHNYFHSKHNYDYKKEFAKLVLDQIPYLYKYNYNYLGEYYLIERFTKIITSDIFLENDYENGIENIAINQIWFHISSSNDWILKNKYFSLFMDKYVERLKFYSGSTNISNKLTDCHSYMLRLNYSKMRKKCMPFAEELTAYVFNPNRLQKLCDLYNLNLEEILDIY